VAAGKLSAPGARPINAAVKVQKRAAQSESHGVFLSSLFPSFFPPTIEFRSALPARTPHPSKKTSQFQRDARWIGGSSSVEKKTKKKKERKKKGTGNSCINRPLATPPHTRVSLTLSGRTAEEHKANAILQLRPGSLDSPHRRGENARRNAHDTRPRPSLPRHPSSPPPREQRENI